MSRQVSPHTPTDEVLLARVGRVVIKHSHLDHALRLAIKRLLEISIDDPRYADATKFMSARLREKVVKHSVARFGAAHPFTKELSGWIDIAQHLTEQRNFLVHGYWIIHEDEVRVFDNGTDWIVPSPEWFEMLEILLDATQQEIDMITRPLLESLDSEADSTEP